MLPKGCKLRCDRFNGRWHCFYRAPTGAVKCLSRSWGIKSHEECFGQIAVWAWGLALGYGQEACPYDFGTSSGPLAKVVEPQAAEATPPPRKRRSAASSAA